MINSLWKVVMKIPGTTKVQLSLLMILAISSVSSTALQISARANNISEENISGKRENQKEESVESLLNQTGSEILSVHKTLGRVNYEETRQLFLNNVLTESVDGLPKYYNNNILGRYMRKDYFDADN